MDGSWNLEVIPKIVKGKQYEAGIIQKTYILSFQSYGSPIDKAAKYYFDCDRALIYHIKLLQAGLDTKSPLQ